MVKLKNQKVAIVTGAAGFIGFHISKLLLEKDWKVIGIDSLSDYYDISIKKHREAMLKKSPKYISIHKKIETPGLLAEIFKEKKPDAVIHLAAQVGVRYSTENPRSYLETNTIGTFELLEAARQHAPRHMLLASTSSVYGANEEMPYKENARADYQMSFYAATKKSTENMSHAYASLYNIPITIFRFFTIYGPWGRPDMAIFKFTKAILEGDKIDVYNFGKMKRDFTYIDDLVHAVYRLIDQIPISENEAEADKKNQSPIAPFRVINIGNSKPEKLGDFIEAIEVATGYKAKKKFLPMQPGDVYETWADTTLLKSLTKYHPSTDIFTGVRNFVEWYREYYKK